MRGRVGMVAGGAFLFLAGVAVGAVIGGDSNTVTAETPSAVRPAAELDSAPTAEPVAEPSTDEPIPGVEIAPSASVADFSADLKLLTKQCFGSAGCNLTARIRLTVAQRVIGTPVEVTVRVDGDEDGPTIETISLDEDGRYNAPSVVLSTPSSHTKLKAVVTEVEVLT